MTEINASLVVDASVIGALIFREPESVLIEKTLTGQLWVAPSLIDYEIGSIYLKKRKTYPKLVAEIEACFEIFCKLEFERIAVDIRAVSSTAERHRLTIYDASYFWLAETLNIDLITLDQRLSSAWSKRKP